MNSDNFNQGGDEKSREEIYKAYGFTPYEPPPPPEELNMRQRVALMVISAIAMSLAGLGSILSPNMDSGIAFLISVFTLIAYVIIGGFTAMLALDRPLLLPIAPITAFALVFGIGSAALGAFSYSVLSASLLCLFPAVGGSVIALAMKRGAKRTGAILASALATALFTVAVLALIAYLATGNIEFSAIGKVIEEVRSETVTLLEKELVNIGAEYKIDVTALDIEGMVNGVFNILPAMAVLAFALIAFFAQLTLLALGKILGLYHKFERKDTEFSLSPITAGVFAIAYIGSVLLAGSDSPALAVLDNLSIILMPALALSGLLMILPRREGRAVRVGCFPLVFLVFLLAFAPALAVLFLAVWGAFLIIKEAVISAKNKRS